MKKLSYLVMSLMLVLSCGFFAACGPSEDGSITLSASNVSIYLGETENNTVLVNALPNNIDVNALDIIYDNTYIKITQSQKLADGSFNLSILSKVTDFGTTTPISVEVKAGDVSAVFYVELVLPVQNIQAKPDTHIAYDGTQTSLYLPSCITFEPAGTKQTGVEFSLEQESPYAHIEGNYLIINSGAEVNFVSGEIPSLKVRVASTVEGKSSVGTEFNVNIIPNIQLLADVIDVRLDYNGAENVVLENTDYNLSISKNDETGNFQIDTFVVKISIPAALGIEVDIDSNYHQNILDYLTYSKSINQDNSNPANVLDVYTFTFEANTTLQGEGYLRFNYLYSNYADDDTLSASFVGLATDNSLVEKLKVAVLMPINGITVVTDCSLNDNDQYIIYQNYQDGIKGSSISFVAIPYGTNQKSLVLVKSENSALLLFDARGQILEFEYNETTLRYEYPIQSNDIIYVKGGDIALETLKCYSNTIGKEGIVKEIVFNVLEGGSGLSFVDEIGEINGLESKTVYMQHEVPAEVLVYSPGSTLDDFIYNASQLIVSNTEAAGYFKITFSSSLAVGDHVINISTVNGYSVQAIVKVIKHISEVSVVLGDNSSHIAGVGYSVIKNNDIVNLGLENSYSAKLNYVTNQDAVVSRVEYSFYEKNISVYDPAVKNLKDVTADNYLNLNGINEFDFVEASNFVSTQNLNLMNLLTATSTGIVVIKINIYGQLVENGNVHEEVVATKYLFVEVYNPVKKIDSSVKNISLRAENELDAEHKNLSQITIDLSVLSYEDLIATYDKVFIDLGKYEITPGADGEEDNIICTFGNWDSMEPKSPYSLLYNYNTKTLTIRANYIDKNNPSKTYTMTLISGDFLTIGDNKTIVKADLSDYNLKTFNINLTILQTTVVEDIDVSNLTLVSETDNVYKDNGSLAVRGEKTYSTIYIDTSKSSSVTYKIYTEVKPLSAFNKNLDFAFNPNSGYSQAMIDISNDGTLTVLSTQGGTGVITISSADSHSFARTVRIPIVVADGNSWETAYEISSLNEIIDTNKHYVLTNPTAYLLEDTILKDLTFNGGLYGKRKADNSNTYATIRLTGEPLFTELGANAEIRCLNICGDVNSIDKELTNGVEYNNGFVAYKNQGVISDVKVTTYINEQGVYVPSTLFVKTDIAYVGGFVGENLGSISNCTFAGSINITNADDDIKANAFAGNNTNGAIDNSTVVIAKFSNNVPLDRIVVDSDNDRTNKTDTIYVNGVVDNRLGSPRTKSLFDDINASVTKKRHDGDKYVLDKNIYIKNTFAAVLQQDKHSYGEKNSLFGLVFYYKALNTAKQSLIAELNTISFEDLFDFANLGDNDIAKKEVAKELKVSAFNLDGTICNFVNVGANTLEINGVGEFIIRITSEYDYTIVFEIRLLSIYYASEFTVNYNGTNLTNSDTLEIVYNQTREIVSTLNNNITYQGNLIELYSNDFAIAFAMKNGGIDVENSSNYITNNRLGVHTINMKFDWNDKTEVYASLDAGYGLEYNNMLNKLFELSDGTDLINLFNIQRKYGTTNISTNLTDGSIEPNAPFVFEATLTTDIKEDYIAKIDDSKVLKGVSIFNQSNYDCTDYFNIVVNKIDENLDGVINENDYKYEIQISLNLETFYGENGENIMNFVNKKYTVIVNAFNSAGVNTEKYSAFASVNFTLLPQTITNINTSLYNVTSSTVAGVYVDEKEATTSVLMPSESGLFVIDMFPSYASFDYLEIVATSDTMSKLSYRLEEYDPDVLNGKIEGNTIGWIPNFRTVINNNDNNGNKIYEAISDKNGIRIFNNANYNADFYNAYSDPENFNGGKHLNNINNIGKYFIKIFADSSFDNDTIFTITVNAYLNGEVLTAQSSFTLYMRMPEAPQLTVDGQTKVYKVVGQEIIADVLVSDDQIDFSPYFAHIEGDSDISLLDNKSLSNIILSYWQVSDNDTIGYKRYKIAIEFDTTYDYKIDTTQLKLVVETTKIFNGKSIKVSSDVFIYLVDYIPENNDIQVFGAVDGIFNVTSLKETELKLADLLLKNVNATKDFVNTFNGNYYYPVLTESLLESPTGFTFGKNEFIGKEDYNNKACIFASYLSYVNNNQKTALLTNYFDENGNLKIGFNKDDLNRVKFDWKYDADGKIIGLVVQGGDATGRVEMALDIQYKMPDNRYYTYEYRFAIVNSLYTTEDLPIEIANNADFINIQNNDAAYDYILTKDLNLYDFTTIANTDKIKSLDGNNHTINIWNFAKTESSIAVHALFNEVSASTTIKNLTVNLYYLSEIEFGDAVTEAQVAGFAITNNGAIYNCEVLAYKSTRNTSGSSVLGIKMSKDIEATVAGFVINNIGSITNSRVGGESKLVTSIEYLEDEKGNVTKRNVSEETILTKQLAIQASGTISGFIVNNSGVVASSFVKNVTIQNTYYKQEIRVTSGFVNKNTGTISMCYTEGNFANENEVQASIGGLEGSGIMSGFVYLNSGTITDSYSNLMITNTKDQVGRLGAGFVFENAESGVIERSYSASKIISNNVTQMNFAGIKDFGGYNNYGKINNAYYYIPNSTDEIAIESIFNTEINAISNMLNDDNFYGFSFKTSKNDGTWTQSVHGPQLVSPNNIAHSLRAKYEKPDSVQSELNYIFEYCEGYELGTSNNPIIIRNALEFNSVLGGSDSTDIAANYSNGKIYGAYRLANHIDMLELVPEEEKQSEYKVNLISTQMMLTGEYAQSTNRTGAFDGNGLTIKNLAISNSSTQSDGFGLFKSIENGASISNLNITLSSGGVTADHTVFVGTLAGSLVDSNAYNISISAQDTQESVKVIGSNVVGGMFGRVIGESALSNIKINNLSVTATYHSVLLQSDIDGIIDQKENLYNRKAGVYSNLSIAGGVSGVVDIYTKEQYLGDFVYTELSLTTSIQSVAVVGGFVIEGMCAGGVFGYIGEFVSAKDLSLTITKDVITSKIIAYNHFAGGIGGYSEGYLYQIKSEHEKSWQSEIEQNYHNYYISETRDTIDRGNEELFVSEIGYEQKAVGGLVGVLNGGKVSIAYSKLNVISNAEYVGGIFGFVSNKYTNGNDESQSDRSALSLIEIYASGDVYSEHINARIGGLIGYTEDTEADMAKLNAVNFWGEKSAALFNDGENSCYKTPSTYGKSIAPIANAESNIINDRVDGGIVKDSETVLSIQGVRFVNQPAKKFNTAQLISMQSYYDYPGVVTDNGAQVDLMFKQNGWYNDNNWTRETLEALPHIKYFNSSSAYIIHSTAQFYLFSMHGSEEDAVFVIDGTERPDPSDPTKTTKLIDCKDWTQSFAIIRGTVIGATNEDGFENLKVTLFRKTVGASITNIKFKDCSVPLVNDALSTKFKTLYYTGCTFTKTVNNNISGVAYTVSGLDTEFTSITFDDCELQSSDACYAGFLFARTGDGTTTIDIANISILNDETKDFSITKTYSTANLYYGLLFGNAGCHVSVNSATIYDNMNVEISASSTLSNGEVNIGMLAGSALGLNVSLSEITILKDTNVEVQDVGLQVSGPKNNGFGATEVTFNVGGLVGSATTLGISANTDKNVVGKMPVYYAPVISVKNMTTVATLQLGSLSGSVNTLALSNNALYIVGQKQELEDNSIVTKFIGLNYELAEWAGNDSNSGSNFVGGLVGSISNITADILDGKSVEDEPFIAYYGDITVSDPKQTAKIKTLALGGLFGKATGGTQESPSVIKNTFFDGTIGFNAKLPNTLYLGGIVGYVEKSAYISIYNTVASGEILLKPNDDANVSDDAKDINLSGSRFAGGLAGMVDGTLSVGSDVIQQKDENTGKITDYYYTAAVITTVFTMKNYKNIDAMANVSSEGMLIAKTNDGLGVSLAQYSSTLTLCTSKIAHNQPSPSSMNILGYVTNYPYSEIINSNISDSLVNPQVITNSVFTAVNGPGTYKGTKLNPYILNTNGANTLPTFTSHSQAENTNSQFYAIANSSTLSYEMASSSNRKLYVYVESDVRWIKKQLSLTNTFLFGDGAAIYSGITPINTIDKNSAVSGVIAKVYIDSDMEPVTVGVNEAEIDFYHTTMVNGLNYFESLDHYAGFVNSNSGIIYTCSVQECMTDTRISDKVILNNSTQFYGYFKNTKETLQSMYTGYAGFVAYNEGYIFGSNANMLFPESNNLPVSGFVANNSVSGVISYCYASGENHYSSDNPQLNTGDLFTKKTNAVYKATSADFEHWIGPKYVGDAPEYKDFWDIIGSLITVDGTYSASTHIFDWNNEELSQTVNENFGYDFINWAKTPNKEVAEGKRNTKIDELIEIYYEEIKTTLEQDKSDDKEETEEESVSPYELATKKLFDSANTKNCIYINEIVNYNVLKHSNDAPYDVMPDFYGTYENCYTIVMAKGKNISCDLPKDQVWREITSNELLKTNSQGIVVEDTNNTKLFSAVKEVDVDGSTSKLIENDKNVGYNYYNCDPDYNWNYPTLTGAMFKHFDFLKRCTLCVYDEETGNYLSKNEAQVINPLNPSEKVPGHTIVRDTTNKDALVNTLFTNTFYVQIPNATVLANLQGFIDGMNFGEMEYKYQYTKFVLIANLNFGYDTDLLREESFIPRLDIDGAVDAEGGIVIDGYMKTISNLNLRSANPDVDVHLIGSIEGEGVNVIEIKKLVFKNIELNGSSGIIGEIDNTVTLREISFPQTETPIYYKAPEKLTDNYVGILVRKNGGRILDCTFTASVCSYGEKEKITLARGNVSSVITTHVGASKTDYIFGVFAGLNVNKISDCTFKGSVRIIETVEGVDVTFGGIAGQNGYSGGIGCSIENCLVDKNAGSTSYYLSEGGNIYLNQYDERIDKDPILTTDNNEKTSLNAQIYVATKSEATVGGIVGVQTNGYIHKCSTFASPQKANNDPVDYLGILVGNEYSQIKSIAGGIVGEIKGGKVTDSANRMNITALSVWMFTTNSSDAKTYRYSVDTTTGQVIRSSEYDSKEMFKHTTENKSLRIRYNDANPDPIFKFDNKGMIYVYNEMTSLAYAGGIVGYGLFGDAYKDVSGIDVSSDLSWELNAASGKDAQYSTKLANYGTIKGGYRAIKPVATITAEINDTTGYPFGFYGGVGLATAGAAVLGVNFVHIFKNFGLLSELAGALGTLLVKAALRVQFIREAVALFAIAAGGGLAVWMFSDALEAVTTPIFKTSAIIGNSFLYYKDVEFVKLICNSDNGYNNKVIKEKIVQAITEAVSDDSNNFFKDNYLNFVGSNAYGAYAILFLPGKIGNEFIESGHINGNLYVSNVVSYTKVIKEQGAHSNFLKLHKLLDADPDDGKDFEPLKGYSYDGICPTIRNIYTTNSYIVYSSTPNYDTDKDANKTLHSGNLENNKVGYNNVDKLYNRQESISAVQWGENFAEDEFSNIVPNIGLKKLVAPDNKDDLELDGRAIFVINNPNEWEDVVYTINHYKNKEGADYYLNSVIQINLSGGYNIIEIDDNSLDYFNGIIISNLDYDIQNVILQNNNTSNYGLIKQTSGGVQLLNLHFIGNISLNNISLKEDAEQQEINGGILIGKVNNITESIILKNIKMDVPQVEFDFNALKWTSNFGGLIGNIDSSENTPNTVEASKIVINTSFKASTRSTIAGDNSTDNGFAAIVGKVKKGEFVLSETTLNGEIELAANFNRVGSIVGSVGKDATLVIGNGDIKPIIIEMPVKAASKANTSVGGVVGYNEGLISVRTVIQLATANSLMVTADVSSFEYYACAGGVIGNNIGQAVNVESLLLMGKEMTSYDDVGYVLAGYNQIELPDVAISFPNKEGTSAGIIYGNSPSEDDLDHESIKNIIYKYISSDISKSEDLLSYFNNNYLSAEYVEWNGLIDDIKKCKTINDDGSLGNAINIDESLFNKMIENITIGKQLTSNFSVNSSQQYKGNKYKLVYSYKQLDNINLNSNDNNLKTYQWLLNIHYEAETSEQGIVTSKMIDKSGNPSDKIILDYKFIIRLTSANAKLDDNGIYVLQIIKINDYKKTTSKQSYSISMEIEGEIETTESFVEIITYTEIEYTPTVIYSKKLDLTKYDSSSAVTAATIKDIIDYEIKLGYYDVDNKADILDGDTKTHSNILTISMITNSFVINIKKNDVGNWEIAFNEMFDLEIEVSKSSAETKNQPTNDEMKDISDKGKEDNITDEDIKDLENKIKDKQDYSAEVLRGKGTYTRTLFEETILNTDVPAEKVYFEGAPSSTFKLFLDGNPIKLNPGGNTSKGNDDYTLNYSGNFNIGHSKISVNYKNPEFNYDTKPFDQVHLYQMTIEEKDYVIISCLSGNSVTDYIYLSQDADNSGTPELYSCGYITYQITTTSKALADAYAEIVQNRHSSFFPQTVEGVIINNVKDFTTTSNNIGINKLTIKYVYYSTEINIDTTKSILYCNVIKTTKTNECDINITYDERWKGIFGASNYDKDDDTSSQFTIYYNDVQASDGLSNIINIEQVSTGYGITDDICGEIDKSLTETQALMHRYVLGGKLIGYVIKETTIVNNGSEDVGLIKWKAFSIQNTYNTFQETSSYKTTTETNEEGIEEITDRKCIFFVKTSTDISNSLTAS